MPTATNYISSFRNISEQGYDSTYVKFSTIYSFFNQLQDRRLAKFQGCGVIAKKKIYNVGLETPKLG